MRFNFPVYHRQIGDDVTVWSGADGREWAAGIDWRF